MADKIFDDGQNSVAQVHKRERPKKISASSIVPKLRRGRAKVNYRDNGREKNSLWFVK